MNKPIIAASALVVLVAQGCMSTTFGEIRAPFYAPTSDVEFRCGRVPDDLDELTAKMQSAYEKGWRIVAFGRTANTFLGLTVSTSPVFCAERLKK